MHIVSNNIFELGLIDCSSGLTLLLIGEKNSFNWLADQIAENRSIIIRGSIKDGVSLKFVPAIDKGQLYGFGAVFEWKLLTSEAIFLAKQLHSLADSKMPAHAYLNPAHNKTGIQIMASIGEYEPARIFERAVGWNETKCNSSFAPTGA